MCCHISTALTRSCTLKHSPQNVASRAAAEKPGSTLDVAFMWRYMTFRSSSLSMQCSRQEFVFSSTCCKSNVPVGSHPSVWLCNDLERFDAAMATNGKQLSCSTAILGHDARNAPLTWRYMTLRSLSLEVI